MSDRSLIENYAAQVAARVGQQEAALHNHPLQSRIDRAIGKKAPMRQRKMTRSFQVPQRQPVTSIDQCATGNCQKNPLGTVLEGERPWWFWLAVGAGVGGLAYMASRSGMFRNPEDADVTESEAAQRAAAIAVQAGIPVILWGAPGIGKTAWLEALGEAMGAKVFIVIGSTRDPTDISGMPTLTGAFDAPDWAREIQQRSLDGEKSVLFLDEFSSMTPMVHAALLRVVRDKIAGDCILDPEKQPNEQPTRYRGNAVHVVCAANPPSMGAGSVDLPPPAANRMIHIDWPAPTAMEWAKGIMLGFKKPRLDIPLPDNWKEMPEVRQTKKEVAAFLSSSSGRLVDMPSDTEAAGRSWPSPRSWEMAAWVLGAARFVGAPFEVQFALLEGTVGNSNTSKFFEWKTENNEWVTSQRSLIGAAFDKAESIKDINRAEQNDHLFAIGDELVRRVAEKPSKSSWDKAWKFISYTVEHAEDFGPNFTPAPLAVMASDLLDMANDPAYEKELANITMPSIELLEALDYENVTVRPRSR